MNLSSEVNEIPGVGPLLSQKLKSLEIKSIGDLINHRPNRYIDFSKVVDVENVSVGSTVTVHGQVVSIKNVYTRRGLAMQVGSVSDSTGKLSVVWFNQPFLTKSLYPGRLVSLSGEVKLFSGRTALVSPEYEVLERTDAETLHTGKLVPVYPETYGVSSKQIRRVVSRALNDTNLSVPDPLTAQIKAEYKLAGLKTAAFAVHLPNSLAEIEKGTKRMAFDELLRLAVKTELSRSKWKKTKVTTKLLIDRNELNQFIKNLPFKLTSSQVTVIDEILNDLTKPFPMNRLLEGDVGSGKTVVAATASFISFMSGYQSVFMAPTQILAQQHYQTLSKLFDKYKLRINLITSQTKLGSIGRPDIIVGTHSLIGKSVNFDKVALVVIDEQHRFGVAQRAILVKKTKKPHLLTMTATPIPRTVALTLHGDLDLSVINEMPKGRQEVATHIVPPEKREDSYRWLESEIGKGKSQAFIVAPLIEASTKESMKDIKNVTDELGKLVSKMPKLTFGLLHGRLKANEKEELLRNFKSGKIDVLVTTPVVEVGIDIPNATIMIIENAERFGLAQLHQLRGRVGRSDKKSYCLLFGKKSRRLTAMTKSHSGFELAELDLKLRGPGDALGTKQHGFPELKFASYSDMELISITKKLAIKIVDNPKKFSQLIKSINLDTISA